MIKALKLEFVNSALHASKWLQLAAERRFQEGRPSAAFENAANGLFGLAKRQIKGSAYQHAPSYVSTHEAGHAVYAIDNPDIGRVVNVSIFPQRANGYVFLMENPPETYDEDRHLRLIGMLYAGYEAECMQYGRKSTLERYADILRQGYTIGDFSMAKTHAQDLRRRFPDSPFRDQKTLLSQARKIAERCVNENQERIKALAKALDEQVLMTRADIDAIIGPGSANGISPP